ncbi:MAG: PTS sugar transporter subunit IIC [Elusimicrobia bacterium]|nr:PTS sugar transporter subunit IIC [Elusimicrobiota bacterium]
MSGWAEPIAGAALVAVLELDAVQVGQFMFSRPLVLGPLLGLLFGAPQIGLALGLCCEFLSLDDVPVGARLPLNAAVAVGAALLLTCSPRPLPVPAALPVGLAAGWLHARVEAVLRGRRQTLCGEAESRLRGGGAPPWGRLLGQALSEQAAATFAVLLACLLLAGPALNALWFLVPRSLAAGLDLGWRLAPWLGLGMALHALRMQR